MLTGRRETGRRDGVGVAARVGLAAAVLALAACTTAPSARVAPVPVPDSPVAAEAPADFDVLVAEFAAREGDLAEARDAFLRASAKDPDSAYLHLRAAMLSARLDDLELARIHAERAVALDPENESARILLARLLRHEGDVLGVERALRGDDGAPVSLQAGLLVVQLLLENGRRAEALGTATALVETYPEEMSAYYALASVHDDAGDRAQVEAVVMQAIGAFPDEVALYARLAQLRRAAGDVDGEIAAYRLLLERRPDHLPTLRSLAETLAAHDDLDGATAIYERALGFYPDELRLLQPLIAIDLQRGDRESAAARLENALARRPRDWELEYMLGLVRLELGDEDRAIASLERIPPSHDAYRDARIRVAQIYEQRGDVARALAVFEELRVLQPDVQLDFYTAGLRARTGDLEGGVALVQEHVDANPDDANAPYQMGLLYDSVEQRDEAIAWMRTSLERDPDNAHALNYIGYTLAERGEALDEAESLILRALELAPDDGYITDSLAWVYYMRAVALVEGGRTEDAHGWLDRAVETLERAAALSGGDPVISEHLGDVHLLAGDKAAALGFYEEAVALDPRPEEQPDLLEKLEALRSELGGA